MKQKIFALSAVAVLVPALIASQSARAQTFTTLHSFDSTDGSIPKGAPIQATNGKLYGITNSGGTNGDGTVFAITTNGTLATLYNFCSQTGCTDGETPLASLIQAADGNFYGTTSAGGTNGYGTVFQITTGGKLTTLYNFCSQTNCTDGSAPIAGLLQDTNGKFYGTTSAGGTNGYGTVFRLSSGLGAFVETQMTSGAVGAPVKILGTNLTGTTSVTFNGTPATFAVVSKSEISTTVPSGATTGPVEVTIPSGTLTSNVSFVVTP